jgi:hypothetical protein
MKRALVCGLAVLASCGPFLNLSSRLSLPFEAGRQGASVATTMRVLVEENHSFRLKLQAREGDQADIDRVKALAGVGNPYAGREDSAGIPIPIRLHVIRVRGSAEELLIDRKFSDHTLEVSAPNPAKVITRMPLPSGRYRFRIEALRDIPELAGTPVRFEVSVRHYK